MREYPPGRAPVAAAHRGLDELGQRHPGQEQVVEVDRGTGRGQRRR
ncbi:hypothetical protein [Virgisporangium ochraceum]|nr:hypothetical protein [Virgisporangium ochraceum]